MMTESEWRKILWMSLIDDGWKGIIEPGPYTCNRLAIALGHKPQHYDIKYINFLRCYGWWIHRKGVMDLIGPKCYICKKKKATDAHHITYEFGWTPYFISDYDENGNDTPPIIPVCKICHAKTHMGA
jgi:hypothetical protein